MSIQRHRDTRRAPDARSCASTDEHTAEIQCIECNGVLEREECANDFWAACESEVQIWESALLVWRILCKYSGAERRDDSKVHSRARTEGSGNGSIEREGVQRPIQLNGKKCAPLGAARETNAKRLERRESQRLEALAGDLGFQPLSKPPAMRVVLILYRKFAIAPLGFLPLYIQGGTFD